MFLAELRRSRKKTTTKSQILFSVRLEGDEFAGNKIHIRTSKTSRDWQKPMREKVKRTAWKVGDKVKWGVGKGGGGGGGGGAGMGACRQCISKSSGRK